MAKPINPDNPYEYVVPEMPRQFYLDQLAASGYTGWYDENGVPAPWPEDFGQPGSVGNQMLRHSPTPDR